MEHFLLGVKLEQTFQCRSCMTQLLFTLESWHRGQKSWVMLGLVSSTFTYPGEFTAYYIFMVMLRTHPENGNVLWHPRLKIDNAEIENDRRGAN